MHKANIDVAVLLIFFARPDQTAKVFEQIKKARPSKLFLYQDGPRQGRNDDIEGIQQCRTIVENIDWECNVYKFYQDKNVGCDPSEFIAQKWMFNYVDKGIILEDDDIPSQSFFPFCKELLDKYEHDMRISMISGMCHMDSVDIKDDYFFSKHGPIWGWATWKRTIDMWDPSYSFLQDVSLLEKMLNNGEMTIQFIETCKKHLASGREHYESICRASRILNNQLSIIPSKNLISNIGLTPNATHCKSSFDELSPKEKAIYNKKTFEYRFPLKHPHYVFEDKELSKKITEAMTLRFTDSLLRYKNKILKKLKKI